MAGPLTSNFAWDTVDPVTAQFIAQALRQPVAAGGPFIAQVTPSNQQFNKGATGGNPVGVTMNSPATPGGANPVSNSGTVSMGNGMTAFMSQMASGMAQTAAQTPQTGQQSPLTTTTGTAAPERPKTQAELFPNGTPSGAGYKDPRYSSPSWVGGGGVSDDSSHGARVAGQLTTRAAAAPAPTPTPAPKPTKPPKPASKPPWRWW